jgi:hypothetical protein
MKQKRRTEGKENGYKNLNKKYERKKKKALNE